MKHLISLEDIGRLARACYADEDIAASLISEAERLDIKPKIGDALFIRITQDNVPAGYDVLLDGGEWADRQGAARYLTGLRTALAYYAYGRIIRDGNIQSTRFGAVVKTDDNSADSERSERARQYREAFTAADGYMMEVLDYLSANAALFPEYRQLPVKANRSSLRIVDGGAPVERKRAQVPTVIAGQPGESAYEAAVRKGFRGSEEDWLQNLKQPAIDAATKAASDIQALTDKVNAAEQSRAQEFNSLKTESQAATANANQAAAKAASDIQELTDKVNAAEQSRVEEFQTLKTDSQTATANANQAADSAKEAAADALQTYLAIEIDETTGDILAVVGSEKTVFDSGEIDPETGDIILTINY